MHMLNILLDYMGLTQVELAKKAGISAADLNEMINKKPYGMITKYQRLAGYLHVTVDNIVNNDILSISESFLIIIIQHLILNLSKISGQLLDVKRKMLLFTWSRTEYMLSLLPWQSWFSPTIKCVHPLLDTIFFPFPRMDIQSLLK